MAVADSSSPALAIATGHQEFQTVAFRSELARDQLELRGELRQFDPGLSRQRVTRCQGGDDHVIGDAFGAQVMPGKHGAQADEAEVDFASKFRYCSDWEWVAFTLAFVFSGLNLPRRLIGFGTRSVARGRAGHR
jgi:hypothetical protein